MPRADVGGDTPCPGPGQCLITPTYGGVAAGFEVYIAEGYAHVDVLTAEDDPAHNPIYGHGRQMHGV